jgi:hypothetical protein
MALLVWVMLLLLKSSRGDFMSKTLIERGVWQ